MTDDTVEFSTAMILTEIMASGENVGCIRFQFLTPDNTPNFSTLIGPALTAQMFSQIAAAAANIPRLDQALGLTVPRKRAGKKAGAVRFGQEYPAEILEALGLLMVRVNLLERSLVHLFAAISGVTREQAEALQYSTMNMKAKLDMIRVLAGVSGLPERFQEQVNDALDRAKAVTDRRNDLVHGHWVLNNNNFQVTTIHPGSVTKPKVQTVTEKSLHILAVDYRTAGTFLTAAASSAGKERVMAMNTAVTASSSEPQDN